MHLDGRVALWALALLLLWMPIPSTAEPCAYTSSKCTARTSCGACTAAVLEEGCSCAYCVSGGFAACFGGDASGPPSPFSCLGTLLSSTSQCEAGERACDADALCFNETLDKRCATADCEYNDDGSPNCSNFQVQSGACEGSTDNHGQCREGSCVEEECWANIVTDDCGISEAKAACTTYKCPNKICSEVQGSRKQVGDRCVLYSGATGECVENNENELLCDTTRGCFGVADDTLCKLSRPYSGFDDVPGVCRNGACVHQGTCDVAADGHECLIVDAETSEKRIGACQSAVCLVAGQCDGKRAGTRCNFGDTLGVCSTEGQCVASCDGTSATACPADPNASEECVVSYCVVEDNNPVCKLDQRETGTRCAKPNGTFGACSSTGACAPELCAADVLAACPYGDNVSEQCVSGPPTCKTVDGEKKCSYSFKNAESCDINGTAGTCGADGACRAACADGLDATCPWTKAPGPQDCFTRSCTESGGCNFEPLEGARCALDARNKGVCVFDNTGTATCSTEGMCENGNFVGEKVNGDPAALCTQEVLNGPCAPWHFSCDTQQCEMQQLVDVACTTEGGHPGTCEMAGALPVCASPCGTAGDPCSTANEQCGPTCAREVGDDDSFTFTCSSNMAGEPCTTLEGLSGSCTVEAMCDKSAQPSGSPSSGGDSGGGFPLGVVAAIVCAAVLAALGYRRFRAQKLTGGRIDRTALTEL